MSPALSDAYDQLAIVSTQLDMLAAALDKGITPNTNNIRFKATELRLFLELVGAQWGVFQCAECGKVEAFPLCSKCKAEAKQL